MPSNFGRHTSCYESLRQMDGIGQDTNRRTSQHRIYWNRDINAARNIIYLGLCLQALAAGMTDEQKRAVETQNIQSYENAQIFYLCTFI